MAPTKKKAVTTKPKMTSTKLGTMKVAQATPTKPTKTKRTGLRSLRGVYAEVMAKADAPYKTEVNENEGYSTGEEDEGQEEDDEDEDTDEDQEAEESSGTESEDHGEGEGGGLTAEQTRIKAKLDLDSRYLANRERALKKHNHITARIEEDGKAWKDMPDEALGDIVEFDQGGRYRLVEDKAGSIVEQPGGIYYDTKTKELFKKVRKFKGTSALPYADGEIAVTSMKNGQLKIDLHEGEVTDDKDEVTDDKGEVADDKDEVVDDEDEVADADD